MPNNLSLCHAIKANKISSTKRKRSYKLLVVLILHQPSSGLLANKNVLKKYLESDDISSDHNSNTLEQVSYHMNEGGPDVDVGMFLRPNVGV